MPTRHFLAWATACGPGIAQRMAAITTSTAAAIRIPVLMLYAPPVGFRAWGRGELVYPSCLPPRTPGMRQVASRRGTRLDQALQLFQPDQNLAGVAALSGSDDAFLFQLIHDAGGPDVADLHLALQQRDRTVPGPDDQPRGLGQQCVLIPAGLRAARFRPQQVLVVHRPALSLPPGDQGLNLAVGDECALRPGGSCRAHRQVEHIAFAEQLLRAWHVQ